MIKVKRMSKEQRRTNQTVLKRILQYVKPYSFTIILSFVCSAISVAAQLITPVLTGNSIDAMIGKGNVDFAAIARIALTILLTIALAAFAQWVLALCSNKITFRVSRDLRNRAIQKIQKLPLSYLDSHPSGDLVSRIIADVDTFSDGLLMGFNQLFTGIITIIGTLAFMFYVNPIIAALIVVLTPLSLIVAGIIANRSYKYFQGQTKIRGEQTAFANEMIEGQKIVQAFGQEKKSLEHFDELNQSLKDISQKAVFYSSLTNPMTRFVNNIVYAAVALGGSLFAISGGISVGQLTIFLSYASQYTKPFNDISGVITELQNSIACAQRVFQLLDELEEVPEADSNLLSDGHVELDHVDFSYRPDLPLIQDFCLDVKAGQKIAIVGPTGCGKTTLINLLMRFYDVQKGAVKVAGTDIRNVTRHSLRRNYGMVLQETWLKAGTIRENIAYGKPDASEEEIIAAAKASHAHSFIKRLPNGYDTLITEDGGNISQGQKQLLCIARVMLSLPPMLILDEATSSIDTRTEIQIQKAFWKMMRGRTSFVVAHRLSTIMEADVILVMKDGHIVEQGNHEELLAKNGFYANLWRSGTNGSADQLS